MTCVLLQPRRDPSCCCTEFDDLCAIAAQTPPSCCCTEIDELRAIAAHHAEMAATSQDLVAQLSAQHEAAVLRADDLEVRLGLVEQEVRCSPGAKRARTHCLGARSNKRHRLLCYKQGSQMEPWMWLGSAVPGVSIAHIRALAWT